VSAVLAAHCLLASQGKPLIPGLAFLGSLWNGILFAMLAVSSFQLWSQVRARSRRRTEVDDRLPWER
jgi:hypothetical protein